MLSFGIAEYGKPVPVVSFEVVAKTTSLARRFIARGRVDGTSLVTRGFLVGRGGYDPFNPSLATPVNPDTNWLTDVVWGGFITAIEFPNPNCVCYYCELLEAESNWALGEIAIFSEVQNSPGAIEDGTFLISAIGHFPFKAKNLNMKMAIRVLEQI